MRWSDPASIQVNRRARRAKTDRLDLEQLMRVLLAYRRGEPRVCSMVHVPSPEQEDAKRPVRERERLITERGAHTNRIKALLYGQGIATRRFMYILGMSPVVAKTAFSPSWLAVSRRE